jgi:cystathionine beta-lyase/cystathionine gamma-synthase
MSSATRALHDAIDAHIRARGRPYLHPDSATVQLDMFGSAEVVAWQEAKASLLFTGEGSWSELPPLYARYGTADTRELLLCMRRLEQARAVVLADSGMQATALVIDTLMRPRAHAVLMRQVYNKTRGYLEHVALKLGAYVTIVDDGDDAQLVAAIRPETTLVLCETFTNPLMRAQDPDKLARLVLAAKSRAEGIKLVIDSTIATPWGFKKPLLEIPGVSAVVASGTKALAGQDRDLWGYLATNDVDLANQVMDLVAMRGGILDWRRAQAIAAGLDRAEEAHALRCATASKVARFLASHPRVERVFHPSLADHPDAAVVAAHYARAGSIVSFRVKDASELGTRHLADTLAMTVVLRYATSFDGLCSKVNHHQTVSEYFTPAERLAQNGFDRLIRLSIGIEDPDDLCAALNWMLHHGSSVSAEAVATWQRARREALGLS